MGVSAKKMTSFSIRPLTFFKGGENAKVGGGGTRERFKGFLPIPGRGEV